jgi:hypothetical protein
MFMPLVMMTLLSNVNQIEPSHV